MKERQEIERVVDELLEQNTLYYIVKKEDESVAEGPFDSPQLAHQRLGSRTDADELKVMPMGSEEPEEESVEESDIEYIEFEGVGWEKIGGKWYKFPHSHFKEPVTDLELIHNLEWILKNEPEAYDTRDEEESLEEGVVRAFYGLFDNETAAEEFAISAIDYEGALNVYTNRVQGQYEVHFELHRDNYDNPDDFDRAHRDLLVLAKELGGRITRA